MQSATESFDSTNKVINSTKKAITMAKKLSIKEQALLDEKNKSEMNLGPKPKTVKVPKPQR